MSLMFLSQGKTAHAPGKHRASQTLSPSDLEQEQVTEKGRLVNGMIG